MSQSNSPFIWIFAFGFSVLKMHKLVSSPPLAIRRESGDQAKQVTRAACPPNSVVCYKKTKNKKKQQQQQQEFKCDSVKQGQIGLHNGHSN